ncbi:TonB-dependent receptor family protein [Flavihumibacter rivuli]|uniref:outer membrane beta-barrel family protein n=1 Tax=Flavihumibacter rivuli TaxID=2838156 RepID=UPI001BDECE60|nr:outer membrane beta-barrel family protein [Flavihumibacter rivuli]ULQ57581.1 TonB-dependent receptor family protein [Flavihumibacter rivuli]
MKRLLLWACFILLGKLAVAQQAQLKGSIADTAENKPLSNAVISLLTKDSVLVSFVRSDAQGRFTLPVRSKGQYLLMVTYPRFADYVDELNLAGESMDLGKINLIRKSALLEEVVVSQKLGAIRIKGDTLEFRADSFAVAQGANVEELLKRLPGLQVNSKGEITAQGQKVQKVLVDGEEFFSDDPAVVTQNLRADAIDKVQVFDKKSEQAAFTGIDDGEKTKTINLQLKEDKKKGYFGKVKAGGGIPGYFENEGMINSFKGKRKLAAYGTMANTGKAGLSWEDNNKFGGGDNFEFNEEDGFFYSYQENDEFNTWGGSYRGEGLPKAWTGGVHFSNKMDGDRKHINGNYQFYKQNVETEGRTESQYILPDTLYFTDQLRKTFTQNIRNNLNGFYDLKLDSLSSLKVTVNGSYATASNQSSFIGRSLNEDKQLVNQNIRELESDGTRKQLKASAIWRKKFKKQGRTISINYDQTYSDNSTDGYLKAINQFYNSLGENFRRDSVDQFKENQQSSNVFNSKVSYTEPLSKKLFVEFNYGYRFTRSDAYRSSFNKSLDGKYVVLDSLFSSNYEFDYNTHSGGVNFRWNGKLVTASIGANISNTGFTQKDLDADTSYRYSFINFFPKANIRFKLGAQRGLSMSYNGNTRQPTLQQIQPILENTDPLNIQVGNPNLKQEFRHTFNLFFNDYKILTSRNMYVNVGANLTEDAISASDRVDSVGRRVYQFVNVDGNFTYFAYGGYWTRIGKSKFNANLNLGMNGGKVNNIINGVKNTNTFASFTPSVGLSYDKENKVNFWLDIKPSYTFSKSSIRPDVKTRYWTVDNELSSTVYLPKSFELSTKLTYSWRQKTDVFTSDLNVWLWNAYVAKKFWKNKTGELRLSVNDILNQNIGFQRNASSNFITENSYNTLRRYWLVSFTWNFSRNPATK